jgi:large subunit ribosomal protein L29
MTKPADIRLKTPDELAAMLVDLRREQFNLRFQRATGQTEGQARIKVVRRDIARVKTILTEQQASVTAA